jgi:hypothetical protein
MKGWVMIEEIFSLREDIRLDIIIDTTQHSDWEQVRAIYLDELMASSERHGIWTLYGSTFPENEASLRAQSACGFRVMGRRARIAQRHGAWRDTIITERRSKIAGV